MSPFTFGVPAGLSMKDAIQHPFFRGVQEGGKKDRHDHRLRRHVRPLCDEPGGCRARGDACMVIQGLPNTLAVTLDHMIYHTAWCPVVSQGVPGHGPPLPAVCRCPGAGDRRAVRALARWRPAVKIEGHTPYVRIWSPTWFPRLPVMGHLVWCAVVHQMGVFRIQGKPGGVGAVLEGAPVWRCRRICGGSRTIPPRWQGDHGAR
jgi:hypothetical protein